MGEPGSSATAKVMTLEEWGALDEDVPGELVDGRLEEEEVPDYVHEACVAWLIAASHRQLRVGTVTSGLRPFARLADE